jgi:transcription antitermination factor NusG
MQVDPWSVLQVNTNQEKRVAQHLTVRAVDHYLPLYTERSRWSDRTVQLERPLFPGYLFVRVAQERLPIISIPGVLRLIGNGDIDQVSAAEIDRIGKALASGYVLRPNWGLSVGTRVRIRNGLFAGVIGSVTQIRHQCSIVIALSNSLQSFSVEADLKDIEILDKVSLPARQAS